MRTPVFKPHSKFRQIFSLLLCCLLVAGCLAIPASSAEEPASAKGTSLSVDDSGSETDSGEDDPGETASPAPEESPEPDGSPDPAETPDPDATPDPDGSPEPTPEEVTVRFVLNDTDSVTVTVPYGETLQPDDIPSGKSYQWKGIALEGWEDEDGQPVESLTELSLTQDLVLTAQWKKELSLLFDTVNHNAYIGGYSNGMFKPEGQVTRAEAAKLFYNLLREKNEMKAEFSDVDPGEWYAQAIGAICGVGLAKGYDNGTFRPNQKITKAEFIKMAVSCEEMEEFQCPFPDVKPGSWEEPYVAFAAAKGWVSGDPKGNFNPSDKITRAQAVKILNCMLSRTPDPDVKSKTGVTNFYDLFPGNWAYGHIVEASTAHSYTGLESGGERWTSYTKDTRPVKTGWLKDGGKRYYVGKNGKFLRGAQTIDGKKYQFDSNGAAATGFFMQDGWKRYFKNGELQNDISGLGVVKGPYYIKVYKPANYLIIFAKGDDGKYNIPVRSMLVSCGNPTPTGDFYTPARYRWLQMVGGSWAQWCTQIQDSYLFHSVPNDWKNNYTMWVNEYNNLGTTRSLGCIRLNCEDAKWIYDNCVLGTHVYISPTETSGPLSKPAGLKLPAGHSWDPTDPTAYYLCRERGCH